MASDSRVSDSENVDRPEDAPRADSEHPKSGHDDELKRTETPAKPASDSIPEGSQDPVPAASSPTVPGQRGGQRGSEQVESEVPPTESSDPGGEKKSHLLGESSDFILFNAVPSWMVSMLVHAALLMFLALMTMPESPPNNNIVAVANPNDLEEIENLENEVIDPLDVQTFEGEAPADVIDPSTTPETYEVPSLDDVSAPPDQFKIQDFGEMMAPSDDLMDRVGKGIEKGLGDRRGARGRKGLVERNGGSRGSEAAVAAALEWLALHQEQDGGWSFNHHRSACRGQCANPGLIPPSRNGATAIALLPFLGAGQTHKEGQYKQTVERGLQYLIQNMKLGNRMGELSDAGGKLYSHGLASIALCEAYAMTNDPALLQPAQLSLNFIVYAQDPVGGGWRYAPKQAGDTSVVGWQLMACKSGHMAYLKVPRRTILGVTKFLDFVQEDNGAKYGYTVPAAGPATTAVGLLCRMYLGWKQDNASLTAGVEYLHKMGPSDNIYYDYYATQVMHHYGGEFWTQWNSRMRDRLVKTQDTRGHAKGSWYIAGSPHASRGGRLYCTAMATMILEVYYRHMPIYGKQAAEEEFPL